MKLAEVDGELGRIKSRADTMMRQMVKARITDVEDLVLAQHCEILSMGIIELEELAFRIKTVNAKYGELCTYFNIEDNAQRKTTDEFFGIWSAFLSDIEKERKKIEAQ